MYEKVCTNRINNLLSKEKKKNGAEHNKVWFADRDSSGFLALTE